MQGNKVYNMRLSKLCGTGVDKSVGRFKHEPIIVCKKIIEVFARKNK